MTPFQRFRLFRARRKCRYPLQRQLLQEPLPSRRSRLADVEMLALDFETTGLNPATDRIVAAGWVVVRGDRLAYASAREVRVQAADTGGVGQSAVIHGITDSDLEGGHSGGELLETLLPELVGRILLAHAASIERRFLAALLGPLGGVPPPNPCIDTMMVEQRLVEGEGGRIREGLESLTLDACRLRRGLPAHSQHSAGADAVACAELLLAQIEQLGGTGRLRVADLA